MSGPSVGAVLRHLLVPTLLEAGLWLVIITALGWRRAVGLGGGVISAWGTIPLVTSCVLLIASVATPSTADRGLALLGLVLAGMFVAAFIEEIAYRGFLLHGLSLRLGGPAGIGISSGLFAIAHLPGLLAADQQRLVPALAFLFGTGVFYARIRIATGSIWYSTTAHMLMNVLTILILHWGSETGFAIGVFVALKFLEGLLGIGLWIQLKLSSMLSRFVESHLQK